MVALPFLSMENLLKPEEFLQLLKAKERKIRHTRHCTEQSHRRGMPLAVFENDLKNEKPVVVLEQESEIAGERKFDVYYLQRGDLFHRYVFSVNDEIRLITLMRTSKSIQKLASRG